MSNEYDQFARARHLLGQCGYQNVPDVVINRLRDHYILTAMIFDMESEFTNEEITDCLLSDWVDEDYDEDEGNEFF